MRPQSGSVTKVWKKLRVSIVLELELSSPDEVITAPRVHEAIVDQAYASMTVTEVTSADADEPR